MELGQQARFAVEQVGQGFELFGGRVFGWFLFDFPVEGFDGLEGYAAQKRFPRKGREKHAAIGANSFGGRTGLLPYAQVELQAAGVFGQCQGGGQANEAVDGGECSASVLNRLDLSSKSRVFAPS